MIAYNPVLCGSWKLNLCVAIIIVWKVKLIRILYKHSVPCPHYKVQLVENV